MRLGIIGTGRIAKRFVPECMAVEDIDVAAVYNPHENSARKFVQEIWGNSDKTPYAFDEINELWDTVDAVYIASPHETHFNYIKDALEHGKHVLCEKPMTLTVSEAQGAFLIAQNSGLVLMEAIKTAYCPGYRKLLEIAASGVIGEVKYVESCFTKLEDANSRELTDRKYGGSFTELGSYVCLPILDIFGSGYNDIRFSSIRNTDGIDLFTKVDFTYGNRLATVKSGLGLKSEGSLLISGTKGYIKVDAPWWKTRHFEAHFEDPSKVVVYDSEFAGDGLRYEIEEFIKRTNSKSENMSEADKNRSFVLADLMERFLQNE